MKNNKSYRFRLNALVWVLLVLLLALSVAGIALNIYNIILAIQDDLQNAFVKAISLALSVILAVITLSVMIFSKYVVKKGNLYCYFGLMRNKTKVEEIVQFTHFKKTDSLVAYLKNEKYTVIVISPEKYSSFVKTVRELNPAIVFDSHEEEN